MLGFICRLHQHYIEQEGSSIPVKDITESFCAQFGSKSNILVGRLVSNTFHRACRERVRMHGDWTKKHFVYKGIRARNATGHSITLNELKEFIPSGFFQIQTSPLLNTFAKYSSLICNGNKVIMEVTVHSNGDLQVVVGGKTIQTIAQVEFNSVKINALFCLFNSIRFCEGLSADIVHSENKENMIVQKNSKQQNTAYSLNCNKILSVNTNKGNKTCQSCRSLSISTCTTKELHDNAPSKCTLKSSLDTPKSTPDTLKSSPDTPKSLDTPKSSSDTPKSSLDTTQTSPDAHTASPDDIIKYLKIVAPYLSNGQLSVIQSQLRNSSVTDIHARNWDFDIVQLALSIWTRSPKAYEDLISSGKLLLPSTHTLSRYKNSVSQCPGINDDVFKWMRMQANHDGITKEGCYGGLVLDEMSIQEDIQISKRGGQRNVVGIPDLGIEGNKLQSTKHQLANHVMQFIFHGLTGFRFLVAHYPTTQANAPQIYTMFWDVVQALEKWGFHVIYTSLDGASNNRSFINMHFPESNSNMAAFNPFCSVHPVIFLADPSHLFKKIRNNVLKSGTCQWHTRLLMINGHEICWKTFIDAYEWDRQHGLSIHHKLSHQHMYPNQADKMRNHLAEECLNADMLHLMRQYQKSLGVGSFAASRCDGPILLLEHTKSLIEFFHDTRPISDLDDDRLLQLSSSLNFFTQWENESSSRQLMSPETREDLKILLRGFQTLSQHVIKDLKYIIKPGYINSDIIENIFSQQRGLHHGAGSNPNYLQYCYATNSITLCQRLVSRKSNAARRKSGTVGGTALPFKQLCMKLNSKS
jgi:hypothetical protein